MNTIKKISITLLGCMLLATGASAQTFHYNTTRTFHEAGFTYQANVSPTGMVVLFNANNRHDPNLRQTYRDGSPLPPFSRDPTPLITPSGTMPIVENIVWNALTPAERQRMGDWPLSVRLYVNQAATTPQPVEVKFGFSTTSPFATLPVSVYRRIELEILREVRLMPTERGRTRNFNVRTIPVILSEL